MNQKKRILNWLYLVIALIAFSVSLFKWDNQVWIAAWIAPAVLMRLMRQNKWGRAVFQGFAVLLIAYIIGFYPVFKSMNTESGGENFAFTLSLHLIMACSVALLFLIPFLLDKAFHKKLPKLASSLIFPAGITSMELLSSYVQGTLFCFGQSQVALQPLVMISSIFGMLGLSFLIAWFASMVNNLWEEEWDIKKLGYSGLVYIAVMAALLIYGAVSIVYPAKVEKKVTIAGIIMDTHYEERLLSVDFELFDKKPEEYVDKLSSPESHVQEMCQKTLKAIKDGAKIIVWQEYGLTLESSAADTLLTEMKNLADKEDVYLLVSYARLLNEKEKKDKIMKNLSILFTPEGNTGWEYEKAHPTVGELLTVNAGPQNIPYLDTPYGRIGICVCFDAHFPHYIRQAAVKQIDLLLDPSIDGKVFTPLHTLNGGFRAVENGFTLFRVVGEGYSAVFDPYYRQWAGQNSFEQGKGNFYCDVPVISRKTFFGSIGFIFPYTTVLLLISLIVSAIIKKHEERIINNQKDQLS